MTLDPSRLDSELLTFLTERHLATLSTVRRDGSLHVVAVGFTFDPQTGLGMTTRSAVTVIAPTGIVADSYATAVCVLGAEKGVRLIDQTPGAACLILTAQGDEITTSRSSRWEAIEINPESDKP